MCAQSHFRLLARLPTNDARVAIFATVSSTVGPALPHWLLFSDKLTASSVSSTNVSYAVFALDLRCLNLAPTPTPTPSSVASSGSFGPPSPQSGRVLEQSQRHRLQVHGGTIRGLSFNQESLLVRRENMNSVGKWCRRFGFHRTLVVCRSSLPLPTRQPG